MGPRSDVRSAVGDRILATCGVVDAAMPGIRLIQVEFVLAASSSGR